MNSDYRHTLASVAQAASRKAVDVRSAMDLVNRLRAFNLVEELIGYVARLGPLERIPIPLLLTIASNFSVLNDQRRALKYLNEAYRGDPNFPPTLLARSQVMAYLGRIAESHKNLDRCLQHAPEIAQAHWLRSRLDKQTGESNHVPELRNRLAKATEKRLDAAFLGFALHKELDDLGDIEGAWQALESACKVKRETLHYDPAESKGLIDGLIKWVEVGKVMAPGRPVEKMPKPIFIVGMHRSGTTLLEQLLDASPQVQGMGELYDFTSAMRYVANHYCKGVLDETIVHRAWTMDFSEVGLRYLKGIAWRLGGEEFFTDKLPSNFLNVGFICSALPQAKILHMVRNPVETCFSNLRELFSDACPYSYDQQELADYYIQYQRLMRHWRIAFPDRILDVDYAQLTANPDMTMREVASFCGLEYVEGMCSTASSTRPVATASAMQVRKEVAALTQPKWSAYDARLKPLIGALTESEVMTA